MSELALQLIEENKKTKATRLDLGNCGLTELPEELFECVWLEELTLSSEWVYSEVDFFILYESSNKGKPNRIEKISESFRKLEKLTSFVSSGEYKNRWPVQDFSFLESLTNLKSLNLSYTHLKDVSFLKNLRELVVLLMNDTNITEIHSMKDLTNIIEISISNTQINNLDSIRNFFKLEYLYIWNTLVEDIEPLRSLLSLKILGLGNTKVINIDYVQSFYELEELSINNTEIADIKPIVGLMKLKRLDMRGTLIKDLEPLKTLDCLESIAIEGSLVTDITPIKFLIEKDIEIILNQPFQSIGKGIYLGDTHLDPTFIAAVKSGKGAVLKYLNKPKERLWEARVLVLGEPRAGKTTLRRKLKSPNASMPSNTESTRGIEIEIEPFKCKLQENGEPIKIQYYLWDFGGQDMYRLLHQLFIAEQAVYIIVTDTDRNKNEEEIDFWLETIHRLGRDKHGKYGPVILLQNPKTNREGDSFPELKKRYQELWKQNEDFTINLSKLASNQVGFDKQELKRFQYFKEYLENSFHQLEHIGQEMPRQWIRIRKALNKLIEENWITLERFRKICEKENIHETSEQEDLLKIFHILGFVLHYNTGQLKGMVILNKEWATDALYRVLDDEIVRSNKGWFVKEDAKQIWHDKKYQDRDNELLLLMREFRLCYFNERAQKYIVPSKLPEDNKGLPEWNKGNNVRLYLSYDWLPRPIATQLIVLLHEHIVQLNDREQWIWRKGAVLDGTKLDIKDAQVMILDNWKERRIEIYAWGTSSEQIIKVLMQQWRIVHEPYEKKVTVSKIILCSCEKCKLLDKPFEFEYQEVLDAREANDTLKCNKSRIEMDAADILRGVFDNVTASVDALIAKSGESEFLRLIEDDKLEEALNRLPPNNEITISLRADLARLKKASQMNDLSTKEYNTERGKIANRLIRHIEPERHYTAPRIITVG